MAPGSTLEERRRRYAETVLRAAHVDDPRIARVFATIPRESFLPPGPWTTISAGIATTTPDADPVHLYDNVLIALDREKGINNGEPALHAAWLALVDPQPGETAVHVGTGTGYYTAMLAALVSPGGRVEAYEIHEGLAAAAARNLAGFGNVAVHAGSALARPLPPADVVYVNAGVAAPDAAWLRALAPGGRMIFPWQSLSNWGHTVLVLRRGGGYAARIGMSVGFINCEGQDRLIPKGRLTDSAILATRSLWLSAEHAPDETATAVFDHVWFSSREIA
ncbi:MAG TPA: SAM-dependent methyltransferase [Microvirga sp.]|jgi:protein-L-isoaspartate(D-aspartate) O-methyltransferase|nr:SAM-dependent methyltransferase [Microvirga sp.]